MSRFDTLAKRSLQLILVAFSCVFWLAVGAGDAAATSSGVLSAAATDLVDLNAAMKIIFEDSIFDNTVTDSELLDLFEMDDNVKVEESTGGRYIETAQYFNLPAGVRSVRSGDYIPVPSGPVVENSRVYLKKIQGVVEMLGDVMRRVRTNEGAFLDWGERALPDLVKRLNDTMDRIMLGYGAGILARVNDATPATTLVIDSAHGVAGLTNAFLQFLEGEQIVFSANPDGDPLRDAAGTPSALVEDAYNDPTDGSTIVIDALPTGVADNDYIFLGDNTQQAIQGSTGDDRDFMGLLGMVDDGGILATFQEIVRANFRKWQSVVIDAADGTPANVLNEDLVTLADEQTAILGGGKINVFVTGYAANRQYWRSLRLDRTINDPRAFTGGRVRTSIILGDREIEVKTVRKMPDELAFGLQTDTFKRWQLGRWEWDDTTGSIWNRATDSVGRKDAFYAVGHLYIQMGNFAPRKNFRIDNLDPTAAVA